MNDIIKIIKSSEDSGVLIDEVTETVKKEVKKQEGGFLSDLKRFTRFIGATSNFFSSKRYKWKSGRGVRRAGRGYMDKKF